MEEGQYSWRLFHQFFGSILWSSLSRLAVFREHSMTDPMDEGEGVPMHTPVHSPAHSPIHSPTLQRAANVPTAELMRALMATVADLTLSVAQTNAQQAQTTLNMHAVSDFLAQPREGGRRPEFHGEPARFDGSVDAMAWLCTLELIFDAKRLNPEERFLHALPLLEKSALKIYEFSHPHHTNSCAIC